MWLPQRFKPQSKPEWMSVEDYAALPDMLKVPELRYKISRSSFRTRDATRVTNLLDAKVYTAAELARLNGARWGVKIDLKHLKQTRMMDVLKCKRVEGVLKELRCAQCCTTMVRLVNVSHLIMPAKAKLFKYLSKATSIGPVPSFSGAQPVAGGY